MNKSRNPSGDSNSGRITPDVPAEKGVRVKTVQNSINKKLPKYSDSYENSPDNIEFKVGAKFEAYDYGAGADVSTGKLQYSWWKCSVVETKIDSGYRMVKIRYKGYGKNDK